MSVSYIPPQLPGMEPHSQQIISLVHKHLLRLLTACGEDYLSKDGVESLDKQKERLIGNKQSLVDVVIALQALELKQAEFALKLQSQHSGSEKLGLNKDDMRIIEQFLKHHDPHASLRDSADQKDRKTLDAKKRKSLTECDTSQ